MKNPRVERVEMATQKILEILDAGATSAQWTSLVAVLLELVDSSEYLVPPGNCRSKLMSLLHDNLRKITGYFCAHEKYDEIALLDKGAVRWISRKEWWWLFHESNSYPKEDQLSDKHWNENLRLREILNVAIAKLTLANLKYDADKIRKSIEDLDNPKEDDTDV